MYFVLNYTCVCEGAFCTGVQVPREGREGVGSWELELLMGSEQPNLSSCIKSPAHCKSNTDS